jgi:ABC-2 type transport system permease protein
MATIVAQDTSLDAIARPRSGFQRNVNLIRELAFTNFKLKYTGSALGYVWSLVKPMMLFAIMYAVFVRLLRAGANAPEFPVQLLVAVVMWNFFTESTSTAMNSVASAGNLIRKAYFPRWILVLSSMLTALMTFLINMTLIVIITVGLGHMHLSLRSIAAPLFLLELAVLIMGLSLLLSSAFVFFRDVGHIWEIFQLVLFYGSSIVFPFTLFISTNHKSSDYGHLSPLGFVVGLNPIAQIVEDLRHSLVSSAIPWMNDSILLGLWAFVPVGLVVAVFAVGMAVFTRLTPRFAESL